MVRNDFSDSLEEPDDSVEESKAIVLRDNPGPEAFARGSKTPDYEAFGGAQKKDKNGKPENGAAVKPEKSGRTNRPVRERDEQGESGGDAQKEKEKEEGGAENEDEEGKEDVGDKGPKKTPLYKRPVFIISASIVLAMLVIAAIIFWLWHRQYESTDDAYIDGHVTEISPQVTAPIKQLHVTDNQLVHQGDLLVELDPTDYEVALHQAQAQVAGAQGRLEQARAQVTTSQASVTQTQAEVDAAQVALENAARDQQRYEAVDERAVSRQQLDNVRLANKNAQAQLEQAQARHTSADASVATAVASVKAAGGDLQQAQAGVERAQVNIGYCRIVAPSDGRVTQRAAENGTNVAPGQAMFSLVSPDVWVTANYKETQLTLMKPGQPVTIRVDAFPHETFQGHVDSIQAGSGSRFSLLPAENATGNYVKVVQRVPVKIVFDHDANTSDYDLLSPGLSVVPRVKVR